MRRRYENLCAGGQTAESLKGETGDMKLEVNQVLGGEEVTLAPKRHRQERAPAQAVCEDDVTMELPPDLDAYGAPEEIPPKGMAKWKMALLILILVIGFILVTLNLRGLVDHMRMQESPPNVEATIPVDESSQSKEEGAVESSAASVRNEESFRKLQDENEMLKESLLQAQNEKELAEQELRNAKALLTASENREAELRTRLSAFESPDKEGAVDE